MRKELISLVKELYYEEKAARSLLMKIEYPRDRIPTFHSADTFWLDLILQVENGIIQDGVHKLLSQMIEDFPGRRAEIERLITGRSRPLRVLCLFANPAETGRLRLDQEERILRQIHEQGGIHLISRHFVQPDDIIPALFREKPDILHFAGHGGRNGLLLLQKTDGSGAPVKAADVASAIRSTARILECVILNSCFTADNAELFRGAAHAVAGSTSRLSDQCALSFAHGFYTALGAGSTVRNAFDAGVATMNLNLCDSAGMRFLPFTRDSTT